MFLGLGELSRFYIMFSILGTTLQNLIYRVHRNLYDRSNASTESCCFIPNSLLAFKVSCRRTQLDQKHVAQLGAACFWKASA